MSKRKRRQNRAWTASEQTALRRLWPRATEAEIRKALPQRSWVAIRRRAFNLKLRRQAAGRWRVALPKGSRGTGELKLRTTVGWEPDQLEEVRRFAKRCMASFPEAVRLLCEWGLEVAASETQQEAA